MDVNYFTCTLGQAARYQQGRSYKTINEFFDHQTCHTPDLPAVGFFQPGNGKPWKSRVLSFKDVRDGCAIVAQTLAEKLHAAPPGETVALLCPSSASFLFTWLALIQLGHPVLLIAPQCSASAIAQLCQACNVSHLLYDETYEAMAAKAKNEASKMEYCSLATVLIPSTGKHILDVVRRSPDQPSSNSVNVKDTDVAYLHHTSGTSTGIPKPIPQTHPAAVGVLPTLDGSGQATFTTTPLYHGGIADLFRAWTSNALIWLFPGADLPITAANVCKCLDVAAGAAATRGLPHIKYFSSVPYVLQMMANDAHGLKHLQQMDIVGVGGAALPTEVGDRLTNDGVNLVSRFGSAECGFLMSSHRDFKNDKEWHYLRSTPGGEKLRFEPREDGLSELVILPGWPYMAKHNREDGSYATSDLFEPHPTISNAWRYHSRSDSQLTLITGKKFDPAPLEDAIRASSPLISDALIFGNGKPYPGVMLFRAAEAARLTDEELTAALAPFIEKLNKDSQSHARIPRNMLITMPYTEESGLEKSSKGTVLRSNAEKRYADQIAAAYDQILPMKQTEVPDAEVPAAIRKIITSVLGNDSIHDPKSEQLTDDTDLFAYGVDSVAGMQIRQALCQFLPNPKRGTGSVLPLTVVEDTGTISHLSELIVRLRSGGHELSESESGSRQVDDQEQHQLMLDLVQGFSVSDSHASHAQNDRTPPRTAEVQVLLTGPTGSLGSHILHELLSDSRVSKIHLLVRGASAHASCKRVRKALEARHLAVPSDFDSRTSIWPCKLSEPKLGLSESGYTHLSGHVDVIIHLAWSVNFLLPLRSFGGTHLAGLRNLMNLAVASPSPTPPRFVFCSSVAAVSNYPYFRHRGGKRSGGDHTTNSKVIPEACINDIPAVSGPTGYARSKWVAEAICAAAHKSTRLKHRLSIARVGQLSGASDTGVWSTSEAYPLMLASAKVTGVWPDLKNETLNWLPVDVAARAFVEDALKEETFGLSKSNGVEQRNGTLHQPDGFDYLSRDDLDAGASDTLEQDGFHDGGGGQPKDGDSDTGETSKTTSTHQLHTRTLAASSNQRHAEGNDSLDVGPPVHHVLNPDNRVQWTDLLTWLSRYEDRICPTSEIGPEPGKEAGIRSTASVQVSDSTTHAAQPQPEAAVHSPSKAIPFKIVPVDEWLSRLAVLQDHTATIPHPALKLLGFWRKAYGAPTTSDRACHDAGSSSEDRGAQAGPGSDANTYDGRASTSQNEHDDHIHTPQHVQTPTLYDMTKTYTAMPSLQRAKCDNFVDEAYVVKLWEWIKENI